MDNKNNGCDHTFTKTLLYMKTKTIGVLALQGAFAEHIQILKKLRVKTIEVRLPGDLNELDGLIIPGGESTTISRLIHLWDLFDHIKNKAASGMGIWGTCAGAIILAKKVTNLFPPGLQLMDITVQRNAFGRQVDSFTANLSFPKIGKPFPAIFIRAPIIQAVGPKAKPIIYCDGTIVAAEQDKFLATSFHPELTNDYRFHEYFLQLIDK